MALKLYGNRACPYVQRTRIVAMEKNIPMQQITIPLDTEAPLWFKRLNPKCTVPALNVAGNFITESMHIAEYLDASFPPPHQLFPPMATIRVEIREFIGLVDRLAETGLRALAEKDFPATKPELEIAFQRLEAKLTERSNGPYFLGTNFSLADVALIPFLDRFRHGFPAFHNYEPMMATPRLRYLLAEADNRLSIIETRLTRRETLRDLQRLVGREYRLPKPIVRVAGDSIAEARIWMAASMAGVLIDLRTTRDSALPLLSYNGKHVYGATNAMLMLLESLASTDVIPNSNIDVARAHCAIDDIDELIPTVNDWQAAPGTAGKDAVQAVADEINRVVEWPYVLGAESSFADAAVAPVALAVEREAQRVGVRFNVSAEMKALYATARETPSTSAAFARPPPRARW